MSKVIAGMGARDRALELVDCGLVDPIRMLEACLVYMSQDDVEDMLHCNDMEPERDEEDGQPDEQQEWHDFDPDC
jgi:hypothetical protein